MANRSRVIAMTLVALTVALPEFSGAQTWIERNINGVQVLERDGVDGHERALKLPEGWYIETSYFNARRAVTAMKFTVPQWQLSDRVDYVGDTNGDGVMDTGWSYFIGRGWVPWNPTEIGSFKTASDQARSLYAASTSAQQQVLYLMYVTRADKMYETAGQMLRARLRQ